MAPEIISRAEARAKGLTQYYTGVVCSNGHLAMRGVANGGCKDCAYEAEKRYIAAHPEKLRKKWREYEQNASEARIVKKRAHRAKWQSANPEKRAAISKSCREKKPELYRSIVKRSKDGRKDKIAIYNKLYKTENAERLAPIAIERVKAWVKANPEGKRAHGQVRRARRANAPGSHTAQELKDLLERQNWQCVYCAKDLHENRHLDHMQPLSRGGSNSIENLQFTCQRCNNRKHSKTDAEFRAELALSA